MGVKTARTKQARRDLKKTLRAGELCPYCQKRQTDLDEHLKNAHAHNCTRCGVRFANEQDWKHHMRDLHGMTGFEAVKEDRHKKLDQWIKRTGSKAMNSSKSKNNKAPPSQSSDIGLATATPGQTYRQICEICGAATELPVDLSSQGLAFNCAFVGRSCGSAPSRPDVRLARVAPQPPVMGLPLACHDRDGDLAIEMAVPSDDEDL